MKDCGFDLEATSSTASAIMITNNPSTSISLTAEDCTINAIAATPYTFDVSKGETEIHNIKVNGTPTNIKFVSADSNSTVSENGTKKTGIAAN